MKKRKGLFLIITGVIFRSIGGTVAKKLFQQYTTMSIGLLRHGIIFGLISVFRVQ